MIPVGPAAQMALAWTVAVASLTVAPLSYAQSVPDTIHTEVKGPITLCGVTGANAADLMAKVRTQPNLTDRQVRSLRFELFSSEDETVQWVLTRPSEAAYPAITCREMVQEADGSVWLRRGMRCDADRTACDKLFLEFQQLDEQVKAALRQ